MQAPALLPCHISAAWPRCQVCWISIGALPISCTCQFSWNSRWCSGCNSSKPITISFQFTRSKSLEFCLHFLVFEKHIPGKQKWKVRFGRKSDLLLSGLKFLPCCSKMVLKEFLLREIVSQVTPKEMIGNRRENEISIIGFSSDHFFVIFSICPKMFYSHCFQFLKCLIISLQAQTIFFHF